MSFLTSSFHHMAKNSLTGMSWELLFDSWKRKENKGRGKIIFSQEIRKRSNRKNEVSLSLSLFSFFSTHLIFCLKYNTENDGGISFTPDTQFFLLLNKEQITTYLLFIHVCIHLHFSLSLSFPPVLFNFLNQNTGNFLSISGLNQMTRSERLFQYHYPHKKETKHKITTSYHD